MYIVPNNILCMGLRYHFAQNFSGMHTAYLFTDVHTLSFKCPFISLLNMVNHHLDLASESLCSQEPSSLGLILVCYLYLSLSYTITKTMKKKREKLSKFESVAEK